MPFCTVYLSSRWFYVSNICSKDNSWAEILRAKKSMEHRTAVSLLQTHNCAILVEFFLFFFHFCVSSCSSRKAQNNQDSRELLSKSRMNLHLSIMEMILHHFTICLFEGVAEWILLCTYENVFKIFIQWYNNTYFFIHIKISYWCIFIFYMI